MSFNPTTHIPQVPGGRLLSEEQFDEISSRAYDHWWLERVGLSNDLIATVLNSFHSKLKIDDLVRGEALKPGDVFRAEVNYKPEAGSKEIKSGVMRADFVSIANHYHPYIRIQTPSKPDGYRDILCTGLKLIVEAWIEEDPQISFGLPAYKDFFVQRGQYGLGSLWNVRQRWHLWRHEQDAWALHRGGKCRQRRVNKTEKEQGYSYIRGKKTLMEMPDRGDTEGAEEEERGNYYSGESSKRMPDNYDDGPYRF